MSILAKKLRSLRLHLPAILILAVITTLQPVHASLIYEGAVDLGETGLGNVLTVLTLQGNPSESGCIVYSTSGDVPGSGCPGGIVGGNEKNQSQTRAISALAGITQASDLAIVFNPNESQGGTNNSIALERLVLTFYSTSGSAIASYTFTGPEVFNGENTGTGGSGYVYRLDYDSAAEAQSLVFDLPNFGAARIGLAAALSDSSGSPETFFVRRFSDFGGGPQEVPEPGTFFTLGAGLTGLLVLTRRRATTSQLSYPLNTRERAVIGHGQTSRPTLVVPT